jgi:hypothetical protein
MRRLWDIGIRSGDRQLLLRPETGQSAYWREDDRSPAAVTGEIVRTHAGWLFFAVAVLLLLYGPQFIQAL